MTPPAPKSSKRRRRRWHSGSAAAIACALLAALVTGAYVRGTWADTAPVMPTNMSSGPVCQVLEMPGEGKQVRCAMLLPYSLEQIWEAVTDYDNYGDICPYIHEGTIAHDPNGTCRLEAKVETGLSAEVLFQAAIQHEQMLHRYQTTWDEPSGDVLVNRGHWILTPLGPVETLVELTLEVEVRGVPTFVLRNLSLRRLPAVVRAVEQRLRTNGVGRKW
jgi:ribosome-associated toxin RatA of RatAB toxin-antitoxin module